MLVAARVGGALDRRRDPPGAPRPEQNTGPELASTFSAGAPGGLSAWTSSHGTPVVAALVVAEALIGVGALDRWSRGPAVAAGFVLALAIWMVGQDFGQLWTGQATDPNTAPLIALMAVAILGGHRVAEKRLIPWRVSRGVAQPG
jgi:hypothetical protein